MVSASSSYSLTWDIQKALLLYVHSCGLLDGSTITGDNPLPWLYHYTLSGDNWASNKLNLVRTRDR